MTTAKRRELLIARIAALAAEGLTRQQIADDLGYAYGTIVNTAKAAGIEIGRQHGSGYRSDDPYGRLADNRAAEFAARYKAGETLKQIGDSHGLTRERVRQVLALRGIDRTDGGQFVKSARARSRSEDRREKACIARRGCGIADYNHLLAIGREMMAAGADRSRTPVGAYKHQKFNAAKRGIEWRLTLWQWWTIWQQSGRWEQRGRGHGFMMCRKGDAGPYAVDNVYIAPGTHNSSSHKVKTSGMPVGVTNRRGRYVAKICVEGRIEHLGIYSTAEEAYDAYLKRLAEVAPHVRSAA